jgi:Fe-S oxidoreductase
MLGIFYGCTLTMQEDLKNALTTFLDKAKVSYIPIGTDQCCGIPLIISGNIEKAKGYGKKVKQTLESKGIKTLVTNCPHCYTAFAHEYQEVLGIEMPFKVRHFSQFVLDLIKEGKIKLSKDVKLKAVYHDPCYIGRQCGQIYEEPRQVLRSIQGIDLKEFALNREESTCCGGGGLVRAVLPRLSVEIAKEKLELQALPLGVDSVISACPFCYINIKEGAEELKEPPLKVYDLIQILSEAIE